MWEWFEICCGDIGWSPDTFWDATFKETGFAVMGRADRIERETQRTFEAARLIGFWTVSVWSKKIKRLDQLVKFAWEDTKKLNEEAINYVKERHAKFAKALEKLKAIPWGKGKVIDFSNEEELRKIRVPKPNREA